MHAPLAIALLLALRCFGSCVSAATSDTRPTHIAVADDASLLAVLRQPAVQHITLTADISLSHDSGWAELNASRPLLLRRNVTISSAPGQQHVLDLAYEGDGQLALAPGVVLTFSNLALLNARCVCTLVRAAQRTVLALAPGVVLTFSMFVCVVCRLCATRRRRPHAGSCFGPPAQVWSRHAARPRGSR